MPVKYVVLMLKSYKYQYLRQHHQQNNINIIHGEVFKCCKNCPERHHIDDPTLQWDSPPKWNPKHLLPITVWSMTWANLVSHCWTCQSHGGKQQCLMWTVRYECRGRLMSAVPLTFFFFEVETPTDRLFSAWSHWQTHFFFFTRKGQNGRRGGRQQSQTALWDCISMLVCVCVPVEEWCVLEMVCVLPSGQWHLKQERGCVCVCMCVCSQRPIRASGPLCNPSVTVW